jgi:hypothetical protein
LSEDSGNTKPQWRQYSCENAERRKQGKPPYPGSKQGRFDKRESNQDRPQPSEEIAEVFTDSTTCIVVKSLEDDLDRVTGGKIGSRIHVHLTQVGNQEHPPQQSKNLNESCKDPKGGRQSKIGKNGGESSLIIQQTLASSDTVACTGILEFLKIGSLPERKVPSLGHFVLGESVCKASVLTHSKISIPWLCELEL